MISSWEILRFLRHPGSDGKQVRGEAMRREKAWFERKLRTPREKLLFQQEYLNLRGTEEICRTMEERGLSKAAVAGLIGKSKAFVTQVLSGQRNMTLRTLAELA